MCEKEPLGLSSGMVTVVPYDARWAKFSTTCAASRRSPAAASFALEATRVRARKDSSFCSIVQGCRDPYLSSGTDPPSVSVAAVSRRNRRIALLTRSVSTTPCMGSPATLARRWNCASTGTPKTPEDCWSVRSSGTRESCETIPPGETDTVWDGSWPTPVGGARRWISFARSWTACPTTSVMSAASAWLRHNSDAPPRPESWTSGWPHGRNHTPGETTPGGEQ